MSMGISLEDMNDPFFENNDLLPKKVQKIQEYFIKNHGLWSKEK